MRSRMDRREVSDISPQNALTTVPASSDRLLRQPTKVVRVVTLLVLVAALAANAAFLIFLHNKSSSRIIFYMNDNINSSRLGIPRS